MIARMEGKKQGAGVETSDHAAHAAMDIASAVSLKKYLDIFNAMTDAIHVVDRDIRIVLVNRMFRHWMKPFGIVGDLQGVLLSEAFPFLPTAVFDEYRAVFETGKPLATHETTMVSGREVATETRKLPIFDGDKVTGVLTMLRDVTEEKRLQGEVLRFKTVADSSNFAIAILDLTGVLLYVNRYFAGLLGYSIAELVGRHQRVLYARKDWKRMTELHAGLEKKKGFSGVEFDLRKKEGGVFPMLINGAVVTDAKKMPLNIVITGTDITELVRLREELRQISLEDELTKLHNRRGFLVLGRSRLAFAQRMKYRVFFLFADFDGLKKINDSFGHQEGDRALKEAARFFRKTFRRSDILARIGGDEFVALATNFAATGFSDMTARFKRKMCEINLKKGRKYRFSLSIGTICADSGDTYTIESLLAKADAAMYRQKRRRKRSQSPGRRTA